MYNFLIIYFFVNRFMRLSSGFLRSISNASAIRRSKTMAAQAFPEAQALGKELGVKVIYGVEVISLMMKLLLVMKSL